MLAAYALPSDTMILTVLLARRSRFPASRSTAAKRVAGNLSTGGVWQCATSISAAAEGAGNMNQHLDR